MVKWESVVVLGIGSLLAVVGGASLLRWHASTQILRDAQCVGTMRYLKDAEMELCFATCSDVVLVMTWVPCTEAVEQAILRARHVERVRLDRLRGPSGRP